MKPVKSPQPLRHFYSQLIMATALAMGTLWVATPMAIATNRIIQAEGGVVIKRRGWSTFRTADVGSVLYYGDLVQPMRGASVVVLCENSNRWRVPSGVPSGVSNGCPAERRVGLVSSLRGDLSTEQLGEVTSQPQSTIPYLISPRRTWVLDGQPRLQWHPVEGATHYTVRVVGPDVDWSTQVTTPETTYQGEIPLKPGETYIVVVQADTGTSSQQEDMGNLSVQLQNDESDLGFVVNDTLDGTPIRGLGFSVLLPEESAILTQERDRILAQALSPEAQALSLADFYVRYRLIANAIDTLTELTEQHTASAAAYQMLGNLYQHVGLVGEADNAYQQAIALSTQAGDTEALVTANIALANLAAQTNHPDRAERLLDAVLPIYQPMESSQRKLEFARAIGEIYARLNQQAIADQWLTQALSGYQQLLEMAQTNSQSPDTSTEVDALERQVTELQNLLSTLPNS